LKGGAWLDSLGSRVFAPDRVVNRLTPLLEIYDALVGRCEPHHPEWEVLQSRRVDWALCEALLPPPFRPGETWANLAVSGQLADVDIDGERDIAAARSMCGLFEVWPGREIWAREISRGYWIHLAGTNVESEGAESCLAEIWDLQVIPVAQAFELARPALVYPAALARSIGEAGPHLLRELSFGPLSARSLRLRWSMAGGRIGYDRLFAQWVEAQLKKRGSSESARR
jgi:hypothetical protein